MLLLSHNYFQVSAGGGKHEAATRSSGGGGKRYVLGLLVLLMVDVLWVASAEISKWIYTEKKYEKPFFIVYVRSLLLAVYLLTLCLASPARTPLAPTDYTQLLEPVTETEDDNFYSEATESLGDSTFVPVRAAGETTDSDDATPRAVRFNKVAEVRVMSAAQAGEALLARLSWQASRKAFEQAQRRAAAAAARTHLKVAFAACIPWFAANYLYRVSLTAAAASATTVGASTCGAFALAFAAALPSTPAAAANAPRRALALVAAAALTGLALVVLWTAEAAPRWRPLAAAVGAGACYAVHLIVLRQEFRRGDATNSPVFLGLVGGLCVVLAWPLGGALHAASYERFEWPTSAQWSWLLLDGSLGLVVSEPLWLWGRSLTSTTTASASLALVAPLAVAAEAWRGGGGGAAAAAAATLAGAGWVAAVLLAAQEPRPAVAAALQWLSERCWPAPDRLSTLRYVQGLDEQSEALMASEEST